MSKRTTSKRSTKATRLQLDGIDLRKFFKEHERFVKVSFLSALKKGLKVEEVVAERHFQSALNLSYIVEAGFIGLFPGVQVYTVQTWKSSEPRQQLKTSGLLPFLEPSGIILQFVPLAFPQFTIRFTLRLRLQVFAAQLQISQKPASWKRPEKREKGRTVGLSIRGDWPLLASRFRPQARSRLLKGKINGAKRNSLREPLKRPENKEHYFNNMAKIILYFDGACEPFNPGGNIGCGYYSHYEQTPQVRIFEGSWFVGKSPLNSNNVAEYLALCLGLEKLLKLNLNNEPLLVKGDSQLVIKQMSGEWRIKDGLYRDQALSAQKLVSQFSNIRFMWIARELNAEADKLSKLKIENNGER